MVSRITSLSGKTPESLSEVEKPELSNLLIKWDELYNQKTRGAFVRSRARWLEEEQNYCYLFNLEKALCHINSVTKLYVNGTLTNDSKISGHCSCFFAEIHLFCQRSADAFLNSLTVTTVAEDEVKLCDSLTLEEIKGAINLLKNNGSPGTDGLVSEFYRSFAEERAPFSSWSLNV